MHPFAQLEIPANHLGIHWFGQNSYAIKDSAGTLFLVDPYFPHDRPADVFIHPQPPLDESQLKPDFVLLTHDHGDHTHPETLQRIHAAFPGTRYFGPAESVRRLIDLGIPGEQCTVMAAGESQTFGDITLHAVYSKPPEGVPADGIPAPDVDHLGYVAAVGPVRVYISGDPVHTFSQQESLVDPIAALKPEIGFLTTHPTEGEFPDFEGSADMAVRLGLKTAVPSHYECFVKRNFDPHEWAAHFTRQGITPLLIGYNESVLYPQASINVHSG
jgi:L-ascorbate metabolism protein UlaG (beta-lactamase superfamily)